MNTEDSNYPEESRQAAAQAMNSLMKLAGINLTPSPEKQREDAAFIEQIQQRKARQLAYEQQIFEQNQALEAERNQNRGKLAEAIAWHESIRKKNGMNAVEDGFHWVRICTSSGEKCFDGEAMVQNNRLLLRSDDTSINRSRELVNGRFIIDTAFFSGPMPGFDNLFGFLLFECELPHPN